MLERLPAVLAYHARSKHRPGRYAASLGYLDWDSQPNPFRIYSGAPLVPLARPPAGLADGPRWPDLVHLRVPPAACSLELVSSIFFHALALSAWKQHGGSRWSLRVNPSSGNLHPTEGWLVAPALGDLSEAPGLYHYSPLLHALERRAGLAADDWTALTAGLGQPCLLVGLSSIAWREAWKYGERAFRYCHHDVGHAIAALGLAAALHGWRARLLEGYSDAALAALFALGGQREGVEAEHPDCLLALTPADAAIDPAALRRAPEPALVERLAQRPRAGEANALSGDHHDWPILREIRAAIERDDAPPAALWAEPPAPPRAGLPDVPASPLIRARRSAVAMDGRTATSAADFYAMLARTCPGGQPLTALPWRPAVDLAVLVHRVDGVEPGLYLLVREPARLDRWRAAADARFAWARPRGCPDDLPLHLLKPGDARRTAAFMSCGQDIAADGAFTLGMIADFRALTELGPWMYPRLFWETGAIGQVLYLEAEARGLSGTGIGCFFDDVVHELLGLTGDELQSLYHFTVGGRVDDPRLRTLDPYHHLEDGHG